MSSLCTLLGYSRQAFYGNQTHRLQLKCEEELIIQQVLKHRKLQPRLGTRKLIVILQDFIKDAADKQITDLEKKIFELDATEKSLREMQKWAKT